MTPTQESDPQAVQAAEGDEIDLRAYWRIVVRRRWVIASVFAAAVVLTLLFTLRQTKIYAATATLIIDASAPRVLNKEDVQEVVDSGTGGTWGSRDYYETQFKVLTSRAVAQRVVEKFQLNRDPRFFGLDGVSDRSKVEHLLANADATPLVQARLQVLPFKDSRVVRIQFEDRDPKWAATLANGVAEAYIAENMSVKSATTQGASDWLEQQLADLEVKLGKSAQELFDFKRAHDIVATSWEDRQSMVSQRLVAVNEALSRARVEKAQAEARAEQFASIGQALASGDQSLDSLGLVTASETFQTLKAKYAEVRIDCADMRARYLKEFPKLEGCEAKLAATREALQRELQSVANAAQNRYAEVSQAERKLSRLLDETKSDAFGLNQYERDYLELKRTHDNNQRLYELVLKRLKDTGVTSMMQMSNVRILDRAEPPTAAARPKPVRNLGLAAVVGLMAGIGLALLLEMLDTTITTREQVEERLGLAFLGIIPSIADMQGDKERDLFVHANPRSAAAECMRSIRTNLLFMSPEKPLKTILVTLGEPERGEDHHRDRAGRGDGGRREPGPDCGRGHAPAPAPQGLRHAERGGALVAHPRRGTARAAHPAVPRPEPLRAHLRARSRPTRRSCSTPRGSRASWRRWPSASTASSSTRRRRGWWRTRSSCPRRWTGRWSCSRLARRRATRRRARSARSPTSRGGSSAPCSTTSTSRTSATASTTSTTGTATTARPRRTPRRPSAPSFSGFA